MSVKKYYLVEEYTDYDKPKLINRFITTNREKYREHKEQMHYYVSNPIEEK